MSNRAPATRRSFADVADEIGYVYQKLVHWLCETPESAKTRRYAKRIKRLLRRDTTGPRSIFREECWSLACEAEKDYPAAIRHRENEIRLIRRLHEITPAADRHLVFIAYGYSDLSDRLVILASLYDAIGDTDRAMKILREAKALCSKHGIPFDGQDILDELLSDSSRDGKRSGKTASRAR
jgi:hypothetical protein